MHLTDRVAQTIQKLYKYNLELNISSFYEYAVEKARLECEADPHNFASKYRKHPGTGKSRL